MTEPFSSLNEVIAERYVVEREIGAGGMATVYLARDLKHERRVALKVLKPDLGALLGVDRFLAEIRVTANLQHPHLLPLFDSGEVAVRGTSGAASLLYYVMPFVEGESLRARLDREKQLLVEDALRIARQIASAVDHAHRHGVIHRDLKPENILLQDGQPLVADFGIALAVSNAGGNRITQTGLSLGTPSYMSPEQAAADRVIDGRTDIYSLGAMLYEMLVGEPPHTGSTAQAVIAKVLTDQPRSIRLSRPSVSERVELAITKALAKVPADRYHTAREFADALEHASTAPALPATPRNVGFNSVLRIAVITPALLVALAFATWQWRSDRSAEDRGVTRVPIALGENDGLDIAALSFSPDGRVFAYSAIGADRVRRIYVRPLEELHARAIVGSEGGVNPFFSPDGEEIVFGAGRQVKKVKVGSGSPSTLATVNGATLGGSFVDAETIVLSVLGTMFTVPADGGTPKAVPRDTSAPLQASQRYPLVLPNGEHVVITNWRGSVVSSEFAALSLRTGALKALGVKGIAPLGFVDGQLIYRDDRDGISAVPFDARSLEAVGTPVQLVRHDTFIGAAALSRSGSLVYELEEAARELVLGESFDAPALIPTQARFQRPRFSPGYDRVAVSIATRGASDIWILTVSTGQLERLTAEGSHADNAEWTPDGKVVYYGIRDGVAGLWEQPTDGSAPARKLLSFPDREVWEGSLSRDGNILAYRTGTLAGADAFYRMLGSDSTDHPIAATPASENSPRLSPNQQWVAYSSSESGRSEVYVRPFPKLDSRIQISRDGGHIPFWSADGQRLFFVLGDVLLNATLRFDSGVGVTRIDTVFRGLFENAGGHAAMDVAKDGRRILFVRMLPSKPQLVLELGWAQELARRTSK